MKIKKMSNSKKLTFLSVIILGIGALFYIIFSLLGADNKSKFYLLVGIGIAFVFYLVTSIIKLKKDGVLYDERDGYIEKEATAMSYNVFQIILLVVALIAYKSGEVKVNLSGLIFLLFVIMWITDVVVRFFIKRRN
jgi:hypothetical protein